MASVIFVQLMAVWLPRWDLPDFVSHFHFVTVYETIESRCSPGLACFLSDSEISTI
jgi:hypothetical protein